MRKMIAGVLAGMSLLAFTPRLTAQQEDVYKRQTMPFKQCETGKENGGKAWTRSIYMARSTHRWTR